MAEDTPSLELAPTDLVGIIQRGLRDLDAYCMRPAEAVDPQVIVGYMGRIAEFAQQLPRIPRAANGATDGAEARAN